MNTELEDIIKILDKSLRIEKGSTEVNDNLFELGFDSLLMITFINELQEKFGIELSIREVFSNPTVIGIYQAIQAKSHHSD